MAGEGFARGHYVLVGGVAAAGLAHVALEAGAIAAFYGHAAVAVDLPGGGHFGGAIHIGCINIDPARRFDVEHLAVDIDDAAFFEHDFGTVGVVHRSLALLQVGDT